MTPLILLITLLADPPVMPLGPSAKPPEPPAGPTVLLLDTLTIVEGAIDTLPTGEYRVKANGVTQVYAANQVLFAGDGRVSVQKYLAARAQQPPPAPPPGDRGPLAAKPVLVGRRGDNTLAEKAFATQVQPVLTNLCASCHANPAVTAKFALARVNPGYADPEAVTRNLEAAAALVSRGSPSGSDLLSKLVTRHGTQRAAALPGRDHAAYQSLELWAYWLAAPDGTPRPTAVPPPKPAEAPARLATSAKPGGVPVTPGPQPAAGDLYDPAVFNEAARRGR